MKKQVVLVILDGWGYREETEHNAIATARKPFFDYLWNTFPHSLLEASGEAVGLPKGQIGNSEIGHMTIGAGKVIYTDLLRITKAMESGEFFSNPAFCKLCQHVKLHDSTLHIQGILSPGGVHGHTDHLFGFLRVLKEQGVRKVAIHAFTDGRDVSPRSGAGYLEELESFLKYEIGFGFIASVTGRYYAMDRDNNWDRTLRAERAIFHGEGISCGLRAPSEILRDLYAQGVIDELLEPLVFCKEDGTCSLVSDNDAVFLFNFRTDRVRQLSTRILERGRKGNICFVTLTQYDPLFRADVAFSPLVIETTLAEQLYRARLTQVHIAETEKFPHVTYFMNGGREVAHEGEIHELIPSRKDVRTHDEAPKMRAKEIADKAIHHVQAGSHFIVINFANPDMVGHTANVPAIIEAIEEVDAQLERVIRALHQRDNVVALVTADHGNAEVNVDPLTGEKHTAHTTNLVPFIATGYQGALRPGSLADIAPTILHFFEINKPSTMTGTSLTVDG